jgi:dipeptidyl aminopeptidase/acylaminoacyl peptidase
MKAELRSWFRYVLVLLPVALLPVCAHAAEPLTLERIMADPDWIGPGVERPYWSLDGKTLYYRVKRKGSPVRDVHRIGTDGREDRTLTPAEIAKADPADFVLDAARKRALFVRDGETVVRELASGREIALPRDITSIADAKFSPDGRMVYYSSASGWIGYDLESRRARVLGSVLALKNPNDEKPAGELEKLQLRLFSTLRDNKAQRDSLKARERALREAQSARAPDPLYLGDDVVLRGSTLSPNGRWLVVTTVAKQTEPGRAGKMPAYVTESGYEEFEDVRTRVGRNNPQAMKLWLADLEKRTLSPLALDSLPGIHDDPLADIRAENDSVKRATSPDTSKKTAVRDTASSKLVERALQADVVAFSPDGTQLVLQLRAVDNKDRWIVSVDLERARLRPEHRLVDPAWINWSYNDMGWLPDSKRFWYLSEESGFSHLYVKASGAPATALTAGRYEVSQPQLARDGRSFLVRANAEAPYAYDLYRVALTGGEPQRLTRSQAIESFGQSVDGARLWLVHSNPHTPDQLAVMSANGGKLTTLTDTRTPEYRAIAWPGLRIVGVPSSHGAGTIWAKLYKPADTTGTHPIALFVHGAGYLQNVHLGYPNYFREQMFEHLLTERGYIVLDMDFRASQGYGRDWRTAIYRQMGTPELEDLIDGVNYLVREHGGDPKHVGLWGGSYGGFMTLMAMFKAPDVFTSGAALRPVTDWTSYNHGYTSNILNTPQVDDVAYRRSSPIEFAAGLKGPLLICHGVIDDNVLFQDSMRLYQRLMELHKDDFELAPYTLERHGFTHADSWLDEYKRILRLFERTLR